MGDEANGFVMFHAMRGRKPAIYIAVFRHVNVSQTERLHFQSQNLGKNKFTVTAWNRTGCFV